MLIHRPSDYFKGEIILNQTVLSTFTGGYLSYIEFDSVRYWDVRENFNITLIELEKNLPSSSVYREDRLLLEQSILLLIERKY